ncbi:30S ribosomal protein S16 [Candidatus Saganbacteria bacterium]|nr:30S ribosomal protein S16 [Candidatus Saganbacteria bacterium]
MAVKLKLQRVGTKSKPKYRLIAQETRTKLGGNLVEILGEYDPRQTNAFINFKKEKVEKWLKVGAQTTDKVRYLLGKAGIMPPMDTSKLVQRKPKKEAPAVEAKPEASAAPAEKAPEAAA